MSLSLYVNYISLPLARVRALSHSLPLPLSRCVYNYTHLQLLLVRFLLLRLQHTHTPCVYAYMCMIACVSIWPKFSSRCRYMSPPPPTNASSSSSFSLPCVNSAADTKGKGLCVYKCVYDCTSGHIAYVLAVNTVLLL